MSWAIIGTLVGIFTGMMPGLGPITVLLAAMPLLLKIPLLDLFLFYFSMVISAQYYGSIVAIVFGLLGEPTSVPAVHRGHALFRSGMGDQALSMTAAGSFMAGVMAVLLFWITYLIFSDFFIFLLKGTVIVFLLTVMLLVLTATSKNPLLAFVFIVLGLILGKVGIFRVAEIRFLTFDFEQLDAGIPVFPLMCGLIIIPLLLNLERSKLDLSKVSVIGTTLRGKLQALTQIKYYGAIARGSAIGFVAGFIPGASYLISSNAADLVESRVKSKDQDMRCLVAAESANNAGVITSLVPLIVLGLPIVVSEAILLNIAEMRGFSYNNSMEFLHQYSTVIFSWLIVLNLVNWVISGFFYNYIIKAYRYSHQFGYKIIIAMVLSVLAWEILSNGLMLTSSLTFLVSLIIGLLIKDIQVKYCLIVAYFISPLYLDEIYRIVVF